MNQVSFRCRVCGYSGTIDATENAETDDTADLCLECEPEEEE